MSRVLQIGILALLIVAPAASGAVPRDVSALAESNPERGSCPRTGTGKTGDRIDAAGVVYRYYSGYGHRFQPLASFARLNALVNARVPHCVRSLASALQRRGVRRGGGLYWEYDFPFGGGPARWTSGFAQAVAAQALARAGALLGDAQLGADARSAFVALRRTLLMPLGGGLWVREYSFTSQAILNAQLESVLSVETYARAARSAWAFGIADRMRHAARKLLPRFDLGCWARYELGGAAASTHYQRYHVDLVGRLAGAHPEEPVWRRTYAAWGRCVH